MGPEDPDPTPDTPYDPTDPNTPNWPKNVDKIQNRRAVATRTIRYFITENGVKVPNQFVNVLSLNGLYLSTW